MRITFAHREPGQNPLQCLSSLSPSLCFTFELMINSSPSVQNILSINVKETLERKSAMNQKNLQHTIEYLSLIHI